MKCIEPKRSRFVLIIFNLTGYAIKDAEINQCSLSFLHGPSTRRCRKGAA